MYDFTCLWLWSPSAWSGCWLHPAEFHCAGLEQIISWLLPKAGLLGCDLWPRLSLHALWGRCSWTLGPGGPLNFEAHRFPCQPLIRATSNKLFDKHRKTVNCQLKWEKWNKYHAHILYIFSETLRRYKQAYCRKQQTEDAAYLCCLKKCITYWFILHI